MTVYTAGLWDVKEGHDDAFVERWTEFAGWLTTFDGSSVPRLTRDLGKRGRYLSFAPWRDLDSVRAWKSDPEFPERMGRVQEHVEQFKPIELELTVELQAAAPA